jgi:hypothetical protein
MRSLSRRSYIPGIWLSPFVSCPMHKRNYNLSGDKEAGGGKCLNDDNVSIASFPIEERGEDIWVKLLPEDEVDALLGTKRWRIRKGEVLNKLGGLDKPTAKTKIKLSNREDVRCGDNKFGLVALIWSSTS